MQRQALEKMVAADGLHPSATAYSAWADALALAVPSPCS
jgi:lysophospholipase L1-like esterase